MLINLKNIQKTYNTKTGVSFRAISNVSLSFDDSGMVFLLGKSGSGKTTLLNLIGGMDSIDSGSIHIGGKNLARLSTAEIDSYRNTMVGFVFQEFNLIDYMTVFENVKLALSMQSDKDDSKIEQALSQVDLLDKKHEKVKNLSGGQRQRVGIARAIVKNPEIILADEPTGALDSATGEEVMKIFQRLAKDKLVIMVSHDAEKAVLYADRIVEMRDGTIYRDVRRKKEGEKIDYNQIHITSNTLIRLEKGVKLTENDAKNINEILDQKGRKAYINVDTNPQKIKALFPNLREAVDGGNRPQQATRSQKTNDNGDIISGKEGFVPYKPNDGEIRSVAFKKSNLPTGKALKFGLENLKLKIAKMVVTIVIAVIAFTLFATAISFQGYDLTAAYSKTIRKSNEDYIMAINAAGNRFRIGEHEIEKIKAANPKIGVFEQYKSQLYSTIQNEYFNYSFYFNSFIETENASNLELEILEGSGILQDLNSIIISQAAAREFIRFGNWEGVHDYNDLIGKSISLQKDERNYKEHNIVEMHDYSVLIDESISTQTDERYSKEYKIVGIFKTDMSKYEKDPYDVKLYNDIRNYIEGVMIVKPGFRQNLAQENAYMDIQLSIKHSGNMNYSGNYFDASLISNNSKVCTEYKIGIDYNISLNTSGSEQPNPSLNYDNFELDDNQIFISDRMLSNIGLYIPTNEFETKSTAYVTDFNSDTNRQITISSSHSGEYVPLYFSNNVEIKGIIRNGNSDIIVSENTMETIAKESIIANKVLLTLSGDKKADSSLIDYLHSNGYKVESTFAASYENLLSFVSLFRTTIIVFSILLCGLVILLLFTFISSSIKLTRKQIGILRALGARRIDTFKIYALEGVVIGLISFAIATALLLIFAPIINAIISVRLGYYLSAITIGIKDILSILLLMLSVVIVSILIPLRKFNKITPIKAIVEKE